MMKNLLCVAILLFLSIFADAQTVTLLNGAGATVVEVVTENAAGIPTTEILQTLTGSSTSTALTATAATTSNPRTATLATATTTATTTQAVGPVEQPGTTPVTPGGPTPYTYTTTNAAGDTEVLTGIFTPTGPQTVLPAQTTTGTILGYSQWLSMVGTYTAPASAARRMSMPVATGWYYFAATTLAGLVGGAWLIVL